MRQRAFLMFIALSVVLLVVTGAARGGSAYGPATEAPAAAATPDPWADQDRGIAQARKNLPQESPIPFNDFDELFSDRFFSGPFDPFAQMLEFQKRLDSELSGDEKALFEAARDGWSDEPMGLASLREKTRETDKEVIVELRIPGLDKDSLNIDVNDSRIRVGCDAKKIEDKMDGSGREIYKSEMVRRFEKILPIPENAEPRNARIVRDGDDVKIIFPKMEGAVKADA